MVAYLKDTLLMCSWWPVSPEGGHLMRAWRRRSMRCVPERGASSNDQLLQTDSWPALLLWKHLKVSPEAAGTIRTKKPQSNHFLPFFLFCLCVWYLTLDILSCFSGCSTGTSVWGPSPSPLRSVVRTRAWKFDHLCSQSKAFLLMFHHRTSPTHLPRRWFPADFFFGLRLCAELRGPLADRALRKGDNGVLVRGRRFSVSRKSCSSFPPVRYTHRPGLLPSLGLQPHGRLQLNSGQDPKSGKSSSDNTTLY